MQVSSALALINDVICYKDKWVFTAKDDTQRYEGTIQVRIDYPAIMSERENQKKGKQVPIMTYATFRIMVVDCEDDIALYRELMRHIMAIEEHEAREFLRIKPTFWAPFHPHKVDGMKRWGKADHDVQFGVV